MLPDTILLTVHTSCYPTLRHHNSYNRTENHRRWNAVRSPDDGRKHARNMLRNNWLPINHHLLNLVCLAFIYCRFLSASYRSYVYIPQQRLWRFLNPCTVLCRRLHVRSVAFSEGQWVISKMNIKMSTLHAMKACGGVEAELRSFLTSALVELFLNCLDNILYFPAHKTHRDFFVRNFRKK